MIKSIKYFFQAIIIYILFIFGRLLGIETSRKIFSYIFSLLAPKFKSRRIIEKNIEIFSPNLSGIEKSFII